MKQPRFIWDLVGRSEKLKNQGTRTEKAIASDLPAEDPGVLHQGGKDLEGKR